MKASQITSTQVTMGLGLVAVIAVYWVGYRTLKAAGNAAESLVDVVSTGVQQINPLNPNNGFYTGASAVGDAIASDGRRAPLGVRIWEWMNPDKVAAENALTGPVQKKSISEPATWTPSSYGASGSWDADPAAIQYGELNQWGA